MFYTRKLGGQRSTSFIKSWGIPSIILYCVVLVSLLVDPRPVVRVPDFSGCAFWYGECFGFGYWYGACFLVSTKNFWTGSSLAALRRLRAACLFVEDKTQAGPSAA